ncbi:MucBP domain-containing protein [Candidatus Enterococcus ferrettii]|uniref:MucBP domain-containing protein n=1 Tax=Candidatus Enterococcus ferrettii TaxID=2815324 RepID=A0ABV0EUR1_9ENTE
MKRKRLFLFLGICGIFSMMTQNVWVVLANEKENNSEKVYSENLLSTEQISSIPEVNYTEPVDNSEQQEDIDKNAKINTTTGENEDQSFPWQYYDDEQGGLVDSELILKLSGDGTTLYVPGGTIVKPQSLVNHLYERDLDPEKVTKIIIEGPLTIQGIASYLFAFWTNVQHIENIENVDISNNSTSYGRLDSVFSGDFNLQELNLSTWDLTNYDSDQSGFFGACWSLKKLVLGPNFKTSTAQLLTDPPQDNPAYTGFWRAVGDGTEHRPTGKRWTATEFMSSKVNNNTVGEEWADTHVWEPVPAKIIVNYQDTDGNKIHEPVENNDRNVSEEYDVTTPEYKLNIPGYTLEDTELPENAVGSIENNEPIEVTYIYNKNPDIPSILGKEVIAKYQDTDGKPIHENEVFSGNIGESYTTKKLDIDGYSFKEINGNPTGVFTDQEQIVTYIYTKNSDIPSVLGKEVTARYQDTNGKTIHENEVFSGNVGESYTTKKLDIDGYSFKEVKGNPTGVFTDQEQLVTYIYTKNSDIPSVLGKEVTARYQDTNGKSIHENEVFSGNIGESYTTKKLDIDGYSFKEVKGNPTGVFTDQEQIVTYIYSFDRFAEPSEKATIMQNKIQNNKELPKTNSSGTFTTDTSANKKYPNTGEMKQTYWSVLGILCIVVTFLFYWFNKAKDTSKIK